MKTEFRTRCLAIGIAALVCAAPSVMAKQIGTTAAVNPATFGTPPDGGRRTLMVGEGIVFKETIETEVGGQTQILFVDESTLTLGPNSKIVLDEFVYDPATSEGTLAVSMVKGALRFVGGKISKSGGMTIKTPAATIGIRGGICLTQSGTSGTTVFCPFGSATICPDDGDGTASLSCSNPTVVDNAETLVTVNPGGEVEVTEVDPDHVAEMYSNFEGGESEAIDNETVDALVAANTDPTDPVDPIVDPTPPPPPENDPPETECVTCQSAQETVKEPNVVTLIGGRLMLTPDPYTTDDGLFISDPFAANFVGGALVVDNFGFTDAEIDLAAGTFSVDLDGNGSIDAILPIQVGDFVVPSTTVTPPGEPTTQVAGTGFLAPGGFFYFYDLNDLVDDTTIFVHGGIPTNITDPALSDGSIDAYTLRPDSHLGTDIPFVSEALGSGFSNAVVSDFLIVRQTSGVLGEPVLGDLVSHTLQASLAIEGQGVNQKSLLVGTTGSIVISAQTGDTVLSQGSRGSVRLAANQAPFRTTGSVSSVPDEAGNHFFGPDLNFFVLDNNDPFTLNSNPTDIFTSENFEQPLQNPQNFTGNGFRYVAEKSDTPFPTGLRLDRTMNGYFGALGETVTFPSGTPGILAAPYIISTENANPTSLFIRTDTATNSMFARLRFDTDRTPVATDVDDGEFTFGGIGSFRGSYIDEQNFGSRNVGSGSSNLGDINGKAGKPSTFNPDGFRSLIVVHDMVGATNFLPAGVTFCDCAYLKWGYWLSNFQYADSTSPPRREQVHIGTWVAGDMPTDLEMPTAGIASFDGHMIGNVYNNVDDANAQYIAVGDFEATWNFGDRKGTFSVSNFDGTDFTTTGGSNIDGIGVGTSPQFTGDASGTHDGTASGTAGAGALSMEVNGSFFSGPTSAADYMGGQAIITQDCDCEVPPAPSYYAVTTFAAADTTLP